MGTPSGSALCQHLCRRGGLPSSGGSRLRTAWPSDSRGSYEITVTAGGTTVQASTPVTLKCEVESKGQLLETL